MQATPLVLVTACLLAGYLAGRFQQRPGREQVPNAAPASDRQPDRTSATVLATPSSCAELERRFSSLPGLHRATALASAVNRMDLAMVRQLLAESKGGGSGYCFEFGEANLRQALFQRWAEQDQESLISHALAQRTSERIEGLGHAFRALAEQDYERANARLQQLAPELRDGLKVTMFRALAIRDPELAFRAAIESDDAALRNCLPMAMARMVSGDPERAIAACASRPPGKERQQCMDVMAYSLAARDPDAALAWAGALGNKLERSHAVKAILDNTTGTIPTTPPRSRPGWIRSPTARCASRPSSRRLIPWLAKTRRLPPNSSPRSNPRCWTTPIRSARSPTHGPDRIPPRPSSGPTNSGASSTRSRRSSRSTPT